MCYTDTIAFQEKTIFYRENSAGAYSSLAYHTSWFLRLTFMGLIRGLIYPLFCYFLSGLTITFDRYIYFSTIVALMSTTGSAIALALISAIPALEGSASAFSSLLGTMATFCGFFFLPSLIPPWFLPNYYISFYKFATEGLYWNEFYGERVVVATSNTNSTSTDLSEDILNVFKVDMSLNRWSNLLSLAIFPILFHALALLASACHIGSRRKNSGLRRFKLALFGKPKTEAIPILEHDEQHHHITEIPPRLPRSLNMSKSSLARGNTHPVRPSNGMGDLRTRVASSSSFMLPGGHSGIVD